MNRWQFSLRSLVLVSALAPIGIAACVFAVRVYLDLREGQAYYIDGILLSILLALGAAVARAVMFWPRPPY
jgi:hypothetical protein